MTTKILPSDEGAGWMKLSTSMKYSAAHDAVEIMDEDGNPAARIPRNMIIKMISILADANAEGES